MIGDEVPFKVKASMLVKFREWTEIQGHQITSFRCDEPGAKNISFY